MDALVLLCVVSVLANSVWLARISYRMYAIEVVLGLDNND